MKNKILAIIFGIALISLASALYSGECMEVDLSGLENLENLNYDVVGNESDLEGLTIDLNGTTANICTVKNYKPDSFTIIFFSNEKEIVHHYSSGGGGGSTIYRDRNITEYIEVDNYIDRPTNDTTIGIEEVDYEEQRKNIIGLIAVIFGLLLIGAGIAFMIIYFIKKRRIKNEEQ